MRLFFGRAGGVSRGDVGSLNLGAGVADDPACLRENWARVQQAVPDLTIMIPRQVHGTKVVAIASPQQQPGEADGLMTSACGVALGVLTADCVPILMVAPRAGVMLAVHAGWRGTLAGIAHTAVAEACRCYGIRPVDLHVAQGPAIGGCCYEVTSTIGEQLEKRWGAMPRAWRPAGKRGMLDLRQANREILSGCGVPDNQILDVGPCTACQWKKFFSHRRSQGRAGRQLSLVGSAS